MTDREGRIGVENATINTFLEMNQDKIAKIIQIGIFY